MTPEQSLDKIREKKGVELSRLGSSRALYADIHGEMAKENILRVAATAELSAAETFEEWSDDEDGNVAEAFTKIAAEEYGHYQSLVDELGSHDPGETPAIQRHLRDVTGTVERIGGFVGRTLAGGKSKEHIAGFFVGQGDTETAALFNEMGDDLEDQLARSLDLLDAACGDDADRWERAKEAGIGAIDVAYGEYTDNLEKLGVDPKPIC